MLSLYSTRTQNTWRRGLALGNAPDARFLRYPTQNIPTCWYILALPPTPTPDASQWNIGGVGLSGVGAGVGHVHFMLFMSISFASGTQRKLVFQWNMGFMVYAWDKSAIKRQALVMGRKHCFIPNRTTTVPLTLSVVELSDLLITYSLP